jgi:hypothetical protein
MTDNRQESEQDDWESEGGAYVPETNGEKSTEQTPPPARKSIFAALRGIARPKKS